MRITDLAKAIAPDCEIDIIGIRPGEKLHEVMISPDDARHTREYDDHYVIEPEFHWWGERQVAGGGVPSAEGFTYSSESNDCWLELEDLRAMVRQIDPTFQP